MRKSICQYTAINEDICKRIENFVEENRSHFSQPKDDDDKKMRNMAVIRSFSAIVFDIDTLALQDEYAGAKSLYDEWMKAEKDFTKSLSIIYRLQLAGKALCVTGCPEQIDSDEYEVEIDKYINERDKYVTLCKKCWRIKLTRWIISRLSATELEYPLIFI